MRAVLIALLIAIAFASVAHAGLGGDIGGQVYSSTALKCYRDKGYKWVIFRLLRSFGGIDTEAKQNAKNAIAAGYPFVDYYLFFCYGKTGLLAQAKAAAAEAKAIGVKFSRLWFDVEKNFGSGCGWPTTTSGRATACANLKTAISAVQAMGIKVGVYSSKYMWEDTVGASCNVASADIPVWFSRYQTPEKRDLNGFLTFGGWTKAFMKQYNDKTDYCGVHSDGNYYDDASFPRI